MPIYFFSFPSDFPLVTDEQAAEAAGFVIPEYPPSLADTGQLTYPTDEDSVGASFSAVDTSVMGTYSGVWGQGEPQQGR